MEKNYPSDHSADLKERLSTAQSEVLEGRTPQLSFSAFQKGWIKRFGQEIVEQVVIPRRTLMRRKSKGERLSEEETDRALRLARLVIHADRVFHSEEKAMRWLLKPNTKFGKKAPCALLTTDVGYSLVEETLFQIEHGMFA